MFSVGRVVATRVATRAVNAGAFSAIRQPLYVRTFAGAQTFLDAGSVTERIISVVKNFDQVDGNKVTDKVKFVDDLDERYKSAQETKKAVETRLRKDLSLAPRLRISTIGSQAVR